MINIEKVSNGYIIRGRKGGAPQSWVATTQAELMQIIEQECDK
jgi:hypothetical protein